MNLLKLFKIILDNILVVISVIYLWCLPICIYNKTVNYEPYQLTLAILALGIYLGDKIDYYNTKK